MWVRILPGVLFDIMTTTNLTRWLELFERDETLRPKGLSHAGELWWLESPVIEYIPIQDEQAELLIIGRAIQWFNTKHEGLTIGDGPWDEKYTGRWPSGFSVEVISPVIAKNIQSGETLIDALYESVIVVLENEERHALPKETS